MQIKDIQKPNLLMYEFMTAEEMNIVDQKIPEGDDYYGYFFHYKDELYLSTDFSAINTEDPFLPKGFEDWDGYLADSFFSGILIKYHTDDTLTVAQYCS